MKKIMLVLILILFISNANSQINIRISKVIIENYCFDNNTYYDEDYGLGPIITLEIRFCNIGNDTIQMSFSDLDYYFTFNYKGKKYKTFQTCVYEFISEENYILSPSDCLKFEIPTEIFFKTGLIYTKKRDYKPLLNSILPTYRMYCNFNGINYISSYIDKIEYYLP